MHMRLAGGAARRLLAETNAILVSAASAWEIATKVRLGKLPGAVEVAADLAAILRQQNFESLPIAIVHALRAGSLPVAHRDPFDRVLIAQAPRSECPEKGRTDVGNWRNHALVR